jgi:SAM-dependent methyltransferase
VPGECCVCGPGPATEVGSGTDFEYDTCPDTFHVMCCGRCGLLYLDPRPDVAEFERIYPPQYHSLNFSAREFGLVHRVRSRLEARRLLRYCRGVPPDARILDVGCGDGFHLDLIRRYGSPGWTVEGVDLDDRAVAQARQRGLTVHLGEVEDLTFMSERYDVVYMIQTIEHVAAPAEVLSVIHRVLRPGGRLVIVTDNSDSVDAHWFRKRYWGGYHFPRHWNLFNRRAMTQLAARTGFNLVNIRTLVSPVNWVYSIRNWLVGRGSPAWLVERFSLRAPVSLAVFTLVDIVLQRLGRGALLNAVLQKPTRPRRVW